MKKHTQLATGYDKVVLGAIVWEKYHSFFLKARSALSTSAKLRNNIISKKRLKRHLFLLELLELNLFFLHFERNIQKWKSYHPMIYMKAGIHIFEIDVAKIKNRKGNSENRYFRNEASQRDQNKSELCSKLCKAKIQGRVHSTIWKSKKITFS